MSINNAVEIRFSKYPGDIFPQTGINTDVNLSISKDFKMNIGLQDTSNYIRFDNTTNNIHIYGNTVFHGNVVSANGTAIGGGGEATSITDMNINNLSITNSNNESSFAYIQSKSQNNNTVSGLYLGTHATEDSYKSLIFMKPVDSGLYGNGELHFALCTQSNYTSNANTQNDTKLLISETGGVTAKRLMVSHNLRKTRDDSVTALELRHEDEPLDNYIVCMSLSNINNVETNITDFMVDYRGTVTTRTIYQTSDDRVKSDEVFITDALDTLCKLRPQYYRKWDTIDKTTNYEYESGLIAQEVFYDAPELRHLVKVKNASNIDSNNISSSIDPTQDPDYSSWGPNLASVNYTGLIPYLIKGLQEANEKIVELQNELLFLKNT
jgi:hypothetical protein